ncbi:glycosyltransferase family 4 protein [Marisediminicola sp. LYQ134]|uniref:glycosyltransferase family 4 protein n=1 Tax=Marisediminicola sp. LYQ134 TaxID=3391061 RepID=UPI0039833780
MSINDSGRVDIAFPAERNVSAWSDRNAAGEVPGRWPYGLEAITHPTKAVAIRSLDAPTVFQKLRNRVTVRPISSRRERTVGVTWDENTAHRMVLAGGHALMHTGVIWLTDLLERSPGGYSAMRRSLLAMESIWVLSRAQIDPLRRFLGPSSPPIDFVRFGVDPRFFSPSPYPRSPMVFSAGGDRDRDAGTLLEAFEQIAIERPDAELVVQTTSALPVPPGVVAIPHVSHRELRDFYRRASVVAIATRPNLHVSGMTVALESMSVGRPVVVTSTPGMDDYVQDGETGRLATVGDGSSVAAAVLDLLRAPDVAADLGRAARAAVEDDMTTAHLAGRLSRIIARS